MVHTYAPAKEHEATFRLYPYTHGTTGHACEVDDFEKPSQLNVALIGVPVTRNVLYLHEVEAIRTVQHGTTPHTTGNSVLGHREVPFFLDDNHIHGVNCHPAIGLLAEKEFPCKYMVCTLILHQNYTICQNCTHPNNGILVDGEIDL